MFQMIHVVLSCDNEEQRESHVHHLLTDEINGSHCKNVAFLTANVMHVYRHVKKRVFIGLPLELIRLSKALKQKFWHFADLEHLTHPRIFQGASIPANSPPRSNCETLRNCRNPKNNNLTLCTSQLGYLMLEFMAVQLKKRLCKHCQETLKII